MSEIINLANNTSPLTPLKKKIIFVTLVLGVLGILFWVVFYSDVAITNDYLRPVRTRYNFLVDDISGTKNASSDDFELLPPLEIGQNTFSFIGTFKSVDPVKSLIFITGKTGRVYSFRIEKFIYRDVDTWLKIYTVADKNTLTLGKEIDLTAVPSKDEIDNVGVFFGPSTQINPFDKSRTDKLGLLAVRWNDKRDIVRLVSDNQLNPNKPLNEASLKSTILAKFE